MADSTEGDHNAEVVDCDFLHVGCLVQLPPDDMDQHAQEAAQQHLAQMSQTLVEEVSRISNDVGALCQSIDRLEERMGFIEEQLASLRLVQPGTIVVMHNCRIHFENGKEWVSPPFCTHSSGYKLQFTVSASDTSVEVCCKQLFLAEREMSDTAFFFRGKVAIQLLNQLSDKDNHEFLFDFTVEQEEEEEEEGGSNEREAKLSRDKLNYDSARECQYLKDDSLKFRVVIQSL